MNKIYCNHCGKEQKGSEKFQKVYVENWYGLKGSTVLPMDLCKDCLKEFNKLVEDFNKRMING